MKRKEFIIHCGLACISGTALSTLLQGCSFSRTITGHISEDSLIVPLSAYDKKGNSSFQKYIVVEHERLKYPVCVFRFGENEYTALVMRCTHQGTQLQVFGDRLQCPAHGSEFDTNGHVQNGPATEDLRILPVQADHDHLKIDLSK